MKNWPAFLLLLLTNHVLAGSYLGIGTFQSEFYGSEFDRTYESDVNSIRQFKFGYNDKKYLDFFGGVNVDEDDKIRDFTLGFALQNKLIHLERGKISGDIISDENVKIGEFDNQYLRIDILERNADRQGFQLGLGMQRYQVPHLFEYNDGSIQGPMLQDDAMQITSIGLGVFYDPIYNYLISDTLANHHYDWYFSTSTLALSISYVETSEADDLKTYGVEDNAWLMWGNTGTYELGFFYAINRPSFKLAANIGYHIRANTMFNINPTDLFADKAPKNDIGLDSAQTIMHGITAGLTATF
jgi:hypothetical protein